MKPSVSLFALAVAVASSAAAQEPPRLPAKKDAKGFYRMAGRAWNEGDVVHRKSISKSGTIDAESSWMICMVPPAADFVLDDRTEEREKQYLDLVWAVLELDGSALHNKSGNDAVISTDPSERFLENGGGVIATCGERFRVPGVRADLDRIDAAWWRTCLSAQPAIITGRYQCAQREGGMVYPPKGPILQTLKELAFSSHEKTAIEAMDVMQEVKGRKGFFGKTLFQVVADSKTPPKARQRAAEVLAGIYTDDLTAKTLANIWQTDTESKEMRMAALRGFAFVLSWSDQRGGAGVGVACQAPGAACERLQQYLRPLLSLMESERDDKTEKLSPLGEMAHCVASQYSTPWIRYAKRYPEGWLAKLRKDEKAGALEK